MQKPKWDQCQISDFPIKDLDNIFENEFINVKCFLDACKMEVLDLDYRDTGWQILYKKLKLTNNEIDNHKISRK